jgi:hypothetical protein
MIFMKNFPAATVVPPLFLPSHSILVSPAGALSVLVNLPPASAMLTRMGPAVWGMVKWKDAFLYDGCERARCTMVPEYSRDGGSIILAPGVY